MGYIIRLYHKDFEYEYEVQLHEYTNIILNDFHGMECYYTVGFMIKFVTKTYLFSISVKLA